MTARLASFLSALFFLSGMASVFPVSADDGEKAKPEKVFLDFSGAPAPGTTFHLRIRSIRTRNCEIKILGMDRPPARRDTREILAGGLLFFKSEHRKDGLLVRELEFTPDSICGFIDGERFDYPEFSGRTFCITVSGKDISFRLKNTGGKTERASSMAADVLSGTGTAGVSPDEIPPELYYFLRSLFGHVSDPAVNYLGRSAWMEQGRHAELDPTPVLQSLRQAGIPADKEDIEYFAEYNGSGLYMGIPIRRVNMLIQGAGVPGCDFKLEISLFYPYGKNFSAASGPVRISRKALFVADPYLPEGNALLPGSRMETVETDMTDIQLIPDAMYPR